MFLINNISYGCVIMYVNVDVITEINIKNMLTVQDNSKGTQRSTVKAYNASVKN
jgi:hypothetical protein